MELNGLIVHGSGYNMWNIVLRLLLASVLAGIIGVERELKAKDAGLRTHFLVGIGSALIMIISQYGFMEVIKYNNISVDPSRIAAQVVSGIGFLGAGTIMINKRAVRGLTTAAGIWVAAAIGLACGAGLFIIAIITTVAVLLGLEILQRIFKLHTYRMVELKVILSKKPKGELEKLLQEKSIQIIKYSTEVEKLDEHNSYYIKYQFRCKNNLNTIELVEKINEMHSVKCVNIEYI
ncbi:MAG: MgtC/SapB family protein [Clostridium sp.]|uniref:MgtC/SapB family protein n=1 Tax=Clostridium sp. TaxID=1506 RepID=UPI003F2D40BE